MPQQTDLVLNNASAVAKTFAAITPGSDGTIAEWALKEGTVSTVFPRITALTVRSQNRSRKLSMKLTIPSSYVDASTGLTQVSNQWQFLVTAIAPDAFPEAMRADAVAYAKNLVAHALVQAMLKDAVPAT